MPPVWLFFSLLAFIGTTGYCRLARPRYFQSLLAPSVMAAASLGLGVFLLPGEVWAEAAPGMLGGFVAALFLQIAGVARLHARWRRDRTA